MSNPRFVLLGKKQRSDLTGGVESWFRGKHVKSTRKGNMVIWGQLEAWLGKWGKTEQALSVDCCQSDLHHFHSVLCVFHLSNTIICDTAIELQSPLPISIVFIVLLLSTCRPPVQP
ncbi:unnamed protein product [Citrullus colocynthis]|uniref:Uncharacterized protein n=1 Tax=Citrullus colocynthis TaxID=252529 RepID=A0ABP0Z287_9ROSI